MEGACLGLFLVSACVFGVLLEHPMSPTHQAFESPAVRRALGGVAMGLTLIVLVHTPWGKRSGAHMNPAFTLTFYSLGKIAGLDAAFYVAAQFAGGILKGGVYHLHKGLGVDESVIWGEYYFVEALSRCLRGF